MWSTEVDIIENDDIGVLQRIPRVAEAENATFWFVAELELGAAKR
jgi:hypothetical protein